ncbi:MAG: hypothetical protein HKN47_22150 [Pirellulaceae bacterium]|nr:hypothetical protein [Pirellulaceae bacterium]
MSTTGERDNYNNSLESTWRSVETSLRRFLWYPERDMQNEPAARTGVLPGCLFALTSALVTCAMLFVNGSLVLAFLKAFSKSGFQWAREPGVMQFLLLLIPVLLVVIQWKMIDYIRGRFRRYRD